MSNIKKVIAELEANCEEAARMYPNLNEEIKRIKLALSQPEHRVIDSKAMQDLGSLEYEYHVGGAL